MTTISIDGPPDVHDQMRGLNGSWNRAIETYKRLRGIRRSNYQVMLGMTLFRKNAGLVDRTIEAVRAAGVPELERRDLHLNAGHESTHYFDNVGTLAQLGHDSVAEAIEAHRAASGGRLHPVRFLEDRYQALVASYYRQHKSPLPCTAMTSSCFIDAQWNLYPCSIWSNAIGNLRANEFDFGQLWSSHLAASVRRAVADEQCPHCWTPCEAYPTILGNLAKLAFERAPL
jgi:MoaA/NifB/PqqE/SkfB family radical SAM enzyme